MEEVISREPEPTSGTVTKRLIMESKKSWPPSASDKSANETISTGANTSVVEHKSGEYDSPQGVEQDMYRCQICFDCNTFDNATQLPCGHPFCRECITGYITSKITDGNVYPVCFYIEDSTGPTSSEPETTREHIELAENLHSEAASSPRENEVEVAAVGGVGCVPVILFTLL